MYESEIRVDDELLASGEIPREQWTDFLQRFAADFQGWLVDVEWPGADELEAEDNLLADDVTYVLEGIDCEIGPISGRISINLSHRRTILLDQPERIERREPRGQSGELLEIEASGVTCTLHLHVPEIGESLDSGDRDQEQKRPIELPI